MDATVGVDFAFSTSSLGFSAVVLSSGTFNYAMNEYISKSHLSPGFEDIVRDLVCKGFVPQDVLQRRFDVVHVLKGENVTSCHGTRPQRLCHVFRILGTHHIGELEKQLLSDRHVKQTTEQSRLHNHRYPIFPVDGDSTAAAPLR